MSEPYIGEIRIFPYNYAPRGWAYCAGQIMNVIDNSSLFSVIGGTYGGNWSTTFALPDLRGRIPVGAGNGPGLTTRILGEAAGTEINHLNTSNLPSHNHGVTVNTNEIKATVFSDKADLDSPTNNYFGATDSKIYVDGGREKNYMAADSIKQTLVMTINPTGSNVAVNNMQPYLAINYCIALDGIYPSRS